MRQDLERRDDLGDPLRSVLDAVQKLVVDESAAAATLALRASSIRMVVVDMNGIMQIFTKELRVNVALMCYIVSQPHTTSCRIVRGPSRS